MNYSIELKCDGNLFHSLQDDDEGSYEHVSDNMKAHKRDSGVDLAEKSHEIVRIKNRKSNANERLANGADVQFKSGMIFDLEM